LAWILGRLIQQKVIESQELETHAPARFPPIWAAQHYPFFG